MDALRGLRRHNLPRDLTDLPVVHGVEDRGVTHPLADPQLDADAGVEEQHGCQGEQEQSHHDEGGVGLPVGQRAPTLLTAHVVVVVQEVVFHLWRRERRKKKSFRQDVCGGSDRQVGIKTRLFSDVWQETPEPFNKYICQSLTSCCAETGPCHNKLGFV